MKPAKLAAKVARERQERDCYRENGTDDDDGVYFDNFVDEVLRVAADAERS